MSDAKLKRASAGEKAVTAGHGFWDKVMDFLSCPNLAAPEARQSQRTRTLPRSIETARSAIQPAVPEKTSRFGGGLKLAVCSARNFFAASIRITDMGLLTDFGIRIFTYSFHLTSDLLDSPGASLNSKPR
jgi:hypothetical protein